MVVGAIFTVSVLAVVPRLQAEIIIDFAKAATGTLYKIEIKSYSSSERQKPKIQTILIGSEGDQGDVIRCMSLAMENIGLAATEIPGTSKLKIVGPMGRIRRIEYWTFSPKGEKWIPNDKLKGPTLVGKPAKGSPSFVVNPKPL